MDHVSLHKEKYVGKYNYIGNPGSCYYMCRICNTLWLTYWVTTHPLHFYVHPPTIPHTLTFTTFVLKSNTNIHVNVFTFLTEDIQDLRDREMKSYELEDWQPSRNTVKEPGSGQTSIQFKHPFCFVEVRFKVRTTAKKIKR